MFMHLTCPACGHRWRVPESAFGQRLNCPACSALVPCGPVPPPAPSVSVRAAAQVAAADSSPGPTIRYSCPRCARPLESPAKAAGQKTNCPDCGQRLQIPQPMTPPTSVPVRVVATPPPAPLPAAPPPPTREEVILTALPAAAPAPVRREYCLECGANVTDRPRVQTCPDCGSLFCSAMCYREHRHHAHPARR